MIAYKGFNKDLSCTMGKGIYRYEIGRTYREETAMCAQTGFHCVEEPIEVLRWYAGRDARYCIVEVAGDINEDGYERISCTEMTILKEINLKMLGILECKWMLEHPERQYSNMVMRDEGEARKGDIVVVRGRHPKAAGELGSTIFLVKERKGEIVNIGAYEIDGKNYLPDVYYRADGRRAR